MDNSDWDKTRELCEQLWPQMLRVSDERWLSYRRACDKATFNQAQVALRTVSDTSSWAPKPAELRKLLQGRHSEPVDDHRPSPSWPDLIRQQMNGCTGHIREDHAAMSDDAVQEWYWAAMAVKAHRTYCNTPGCQHCDTHPEVARCVERRERFAGQEGA